jgi:hypothetical protein
LKAHPVSIPLLSGIGLTTTKTSYRSIVATFISGHRAAARVVSNMPRLCVIFEQLDLTAERALRHVSEALLMLPNSATHLNVLSCRRSIACQISNTGSYAITIQHRSSAVASRRHAIRQLTSTRIHRQ